MSPSCGHSRRNEYLGRIGMESGYGLAWLGLLEGIPHRERHGGGEGMVVGEMA